jgi:hypothetical protein
MQVPPPPQADGKKTFWLPRVDNKELPEGTSILRSPLIVMVTGPEGESFSLVNKSNPTSNNVSTKNAAMVISIVLPIAAKTIIFSS